MQKIQYEKGGYLNWTNADWVDGVALGLVVLVVTLVWQVFAMIALRM